MIFVVHQLYLTRTLQNPLIMQDMTRFNIKIIVVAGCVNMYNEHISIYLFREVNYEFIIHVDQGDIKGTFS